MTYELERLVPLGGPELRVGLLREDAHRRHARMELQILTDLFRTVREIAAPLQQDRRRHATGGENHDLRLHPKAMTELVGERPHHATGHAPDPTAPREHVLDLERRVDARSRAERGRYIRNVRGLLGARPATGEALAASDAAAHVAGNRLARIPERVARVTEEEIPRSLHLVGCRRDAEEVLDRLVVWIQIGARRLLERELVAPSVQRELGGANTDGRVHERPTARARWPASSPSWCRVSSAVPLRASCAPWRGRRRARSPPA